MNTATIRTIFAAAVVMLAASPFTALGAGEITQPRIIQTEEVKFPLTLEYSALTDGDVELALRIDSTGKLTDALAIAFTHEAFAKQALDAVRRWRYEPARLNGEPIDIRINLRIHFATQMRVVTFTPVDTPGSLMRNAGFVEGINMVCAAKDLDSPLKVLHPATPLHPGRTANLPHGRTVVDFYIDEQGRARVPLVTESTHPAFSFAVVKALEEWRFAAPKRKGRPAIVRMQQEFVFENGS
ncbi:MAG TPA: TonB family protein [Opitutaceae bacterium]